MLRKAIVAVLTALTAVAGAYAIAVFVLQRHDDRAEHDMVCGAARQWACPVESVQLDSVGPATYRLVGCGHDETYSCKQPGEGCRLRDNDEVFLSSAPCP